MSNGFVKFEPRFTGRKDKITLNSHNLNIGREAYKLIGKPERVDIYYDKGRQAIKLVPSEDGRKITKRSSGHYAMSSTLSRIMPVGKYYYNDGIFFKWGNGD